MSELRLSQRSEVKDSVLDYTLYNDVIQKDDCENTFLFVSKNDRANIEPKVVCMETKANDEKEKINWVGLTLNAIKKLELFDVEM